MNVVTQEGLTPRQREWFETVPFDYKDARLRNLDDRVREEILDWAGNVSDAEHHVGARGPNLLITGPVGCGKTTAAFAACRFLFHVGMTGWNGQRWPLNFRYWPSGKLLAELRRDENLSAEKAMTMKFVERCSILVLDDIGSMRQTPWVLDQLFLVLDGRRNDRRPVIATSNLPEPQLRDYLGEAGYSRLTQGSVVIEMLGEDRRKGTT